MQDALAHGQPYELVYRIRTAQGDVKRVWEQGRAVPVPGEGLVMLYTQAALSDSSLPDRLHAQLEAVISEVDRAGGLIRQILDFGRQTQMELQHLDLLPFLKEQAALLARLLPESIEVGFKYDRGDYLILGDPTRLAQVLLNLALNARDAMPNGG